MPYVGSRLNVIGLCAVLIAGCGGGAGTTGGGGGGGGGGSNPTVVTLTLPSSVSLAAAQIGSGAFALQTLSANKLSLSIPSGASNYAVAYICPAQSTYLGEFTEEAVWEASTADGTSVTLSCMFTSASFAGTGTLTGSLDATAIPGVTGFEVYAQNGNSAVQEGLGGSATENFNNLLAPDGNDRVLVLAEDDQGVIAAAKNFTNQIVPGALNGDNTVVFGTADETVPEAITYNNVPSGFSSPTTSAALEVGGVAGYLVVLEDPVTTQYTALPASAMESGDLYSFQASVFSSGGGGSSGVSAGAANTGGPVSLTFPAAWTYAGPTAAAQPSFNMGYTGFSGKSGVYQEAEYTWQTGGSGASAIADGIQLTAATGFQGGSTALTAPDLSGLTGFLPAPASGTLVNWNAWVYTPQYSNGALNSSWGLVSNGGTFTVP